MPVINVTVRTPFSGDTNLTIPTDATVEELIRRVSQLAPPGVPQPPEPRCIVYSGRVLDDTQTLSQAGIPDNAVLHFMHRPRRSAEQQRNHPHPDHANWSGSETDSPHGQPHEHDHIHEHVHTNVLISHVAFNNRRPQFADIRDMLVSVLQALGFSTNAVNSAASAAAALIIAFDASTERGHPSRAVLESTWATLRNVQQQVSTNTINTRANHAQAPASIVNNPVSSTLHPASSSASMVHPPATHQSVTSPSVQPIPTEPHSSQDLDTIAETRPLSTHPPLPDTQSNGTAQQQARSLPLISVLPENPPQVETDQTDRLASARAADRLMPALADIITRLEPLIRNAPSLVRVAQGEQLQDVSQLTQLMGGTAGAMTAVAMLLSSVLPAEGEGEDDSDTSTGFGHNNSPGQRNRSSGPPSSSRPDGQGTTASDSTSSLNRGYESGNDDRSSRNTGPGSSQAQQEPPHRFSASADRGEPYEFSNMDFPYQDLHHAPASERFFQSISHLADGDDRDDDDEQYRVYREKNADFVVRLVSYYYWSLTGVDVPMDSCPNELGVTATTVLHELYGRGGFDEPLNPFLRILYFTMDVISPRQFHDVCRGNFLPLAEVREEVWEIIMEELVEISDDFIAADDFQTFFVAFVSDKLHTLIHIFDALNRGNVDLTSLPLMSDFCLRTMNVVHRQIVVLVEILSGDLGEEEYANRLRDWFTDTFASVAYSLGREMGLEWESFVDVFRQVMNEIGVSVLGRQFSVVFPLILNLFLERAKTAYDRVASASRREGVRRNDDEEHGGSDSEDVDFADFDHSDCGPGCLVRQAELRESRANQTSDVRDATGNHRGSDDGLPDLISTSDDESSDEEDFTRTDSVTTPNSEHPASQSGLNAPTTHRMEVDPDVELDDRDFDDIAEELTRELGPGAERRASTPEYTDAEFDELASELEKEATFFPKKSHSNEPPSSISQQSSGSQLTGTMKVPTATRGSSSSIRSQTRASFPGAQPIPIRPSTLGHASFSSTAVPVARRSANDRRLSTNQALDEFEVLGSSDAKVWRNIVRNDATRIAGSRYKPLSRGYRFDVEPLQTLDHKKAIELVGQSVEAAATEVPVTPSEKKAIQRILQENSDACLEHIESEVRSRLLEDEDFDSDAYPSASSRFLAWADMPE